MRIKQRVKITRLQTEDGLVEIGGPIGAELWIECNTFAVRTFARKLDPTKTFQELMVKTETEEYIPAEILEYTNDFTVSP